jgi:hypothetical protein
VNLRNWLLTESWPAAFKSPHVTGDYYVGPLEPGLSLPETKCDLNGRRLSEDLEPASGR